MTDKAVDKKKKAMADHLVEYGLDKKDAEVLVNKLDSFKELSEEDTTQASRDGGSEGSGEFVEQEAREISVDGKARLDMARFLLTVNPEDSIEKRIAMSEIPAPSLMHLVMSKTLDDLCGTRKARRAKNAESNGNGKITPISVFITNYTTFMLGLNRKNRKEGLQIFETDSEKTSDTAGLFPSLQG